MLAVSASQYHFEFANISNQVYPVLLVHHVSLHLLHNRLQGFQILWLSSEICFSVKMQVYENNQLLLFLYALHQKPLLKKSLVY
jgi:hypothetical protein